MKKLKNNAITISLIILAITSILLIPLNVFAESTKISTDIQIVKAENDDYIIYVKEMANIEFKFAISDSETLDPSSVDLNYINSVQDTEGNNVAYIEKSKEAIAKYIYIKESENTKIAKIDLSKAFEKSKMEQVETTTKRIATELLTNLEERNEEINGVAYKETVGGLKITDESNAKYQFVRVKLPAEKYSTLQELGEKINSEYNEKDMYSKIELAKEFNSLYEELINTANIQNSWEDVENLEIRQPIEAQKGDKYVVLLKKVSQNETETYDAKFLTSYREDEEEKIPGRTEKNIVHETSKLPITGESIAIFIALAVIIIATIFVFIKMKKEQNKGKNKMKLKIYKIIFIILIITLIILFGKIIAKTIENHNYDIENHKTVETFSEITQKGENEEVLLQGYKVIGIVNIPKINIEYPILDINTYNPEETKVPMKISIVKYWGGNVNDYGNLSIAGHNNYDGTMFGKTKKLEEGDIIELTDLQNIKIQYKIYSKFVTDPNDVTILESNNYESREVTLITCTNGNKNRLILKAKEI